MAPKNKWDPEAKIKLLLTILEVANVSISHAQYDQVAKKMGGGHKGEALRWQVRQMKKMAGGTTPSKPGNDSNGGVSKQAGKESKSGSGMDGDGEDETPSKKRASPRKRATKKYAEPKTPEDTEEEESESPTKKIKAEDDGVGNVDSSELDDGLEV